MHKKSVIDENIKIKKDFIIVAVLTYSFIKSLFTTK